jgi:altronate dehydratase
MKEHIDIDVSAITSETETLEAEGQRVYEYAISVANGTMTRAEILNFDGTMEILINGPVI